VHSTVVTRVIDRVIESMFVPLSGFQHVKSHDVDAQ